MPQPLAVQWSINYKDVSPDEAHIVTSYMNRGQRHNIADEGRVMPVAVRLPVALFLELIAPIYDDVVQDERDDVMYKPGEDWLSDELRARDFPSLQKLWSDSKDMLARFVLEFETDFLEALETPSPEKQVPLYYIHTLNSYQFHESEIEFSGTCILSAS